MRCTRRGERTNRWNSCRGRPRPSSRADFRWKSDSCAERRAASSALCTPWGIAKSRRSGFRRADESCSSRGDPMSSLSVGVLSGLVFGVVAVLTMLPLEFPDKTAALSAAFLNRLAIGVAIGAVQIAWPGWAVGLMFGLLLSVPEAIITKAWAPIVGMGAVGGVLIGLAV